jgi:hypothetical protein
MPNHPDVPTWPGDAWFGLALGVLIFLGLTLLFIAGGVFLVRWL